MPYVSQKQQAWAHTENGMKALGGASKVAEWDSASKGMKLPVRVTAPKGPAAIKAPAGSRMMRKPFGSFAP